MLELLFQMPKTSWTDLECLLRLFLPICPKNSWYSSAIWNKWRKLETELVFIIHMHECCKKSLYCTSILLWIYQYLHCFSLFWNYFILVVPHPPVLGVFSTFRILRAVYNNTVLLESLATAVYNTSSYRSVVLYVI